MAERANSPPDNKHEVIILDLPSKPKSNQYYYVKDIVKILGVSRSKAYKIIALLHSKNPNVCKNETNGQINKLIFNKYLYK